MSGAAEGIAGLALSAVSVAALFTTCIQCFDIVVAGKNFSEDYEQLFALFAIQRTRFGLWGESVGLIPNPNDGRCLPYNENIDRRDIRPGIESILNNIKILLREADNVDERYGLKAVAGRPTDVSTSLGLNILRDSFERFKDRIKKNQKQKSAWKVTRWAIHDATKFKTLINRLEKYVDGLEKLTDSLGRLEERLREEIDSIPDVQSLRLLRDASSSHRNSSRNDLSDTASRRILRISEAGFETQSLATASLTYVASKSFVTAESRLSSQIGSLPSSNLPLPGSWPRSTRSDSSQKVRYAFPPTHRVEPMLKANRSCVECLAEHYKCELQDTAFSCSRCYNKNRSCSFDRELTEQTSPILQEDVKGSENGQQWNSGGQADTPLPEDVPQNKRLLSKLVQNANPPEPLSFSTGDAHYGEILKTIKTKDINSLLQNSPKLLNQASTGSSAAKRMFFELRDIRTANVPFVSAAPIEDNLDRVLASIEGPPETPYEGGVFWIAVRLSHKDVMGPPLMRFHTKIYHPNISPQGHICANYEEKWRSVFYTGPRRTVTSSDALWYHGKSQVIHWSLGALLTALCGLLASPDVEDPLVPEIAQKYLTDYSGYCEAARLYTERYATRERPNENEVIFLDDEMNIEDNISASFPQITLEPDVDIVSVQRSLREAYDEPFPMDGAVSSSISVNSHRSSNTDEINEFSTKIKSKIMDRYEKVIENTILSSTIPVSKDLIEVVWNLVAKEWDFNHWWVPTHIDVGYRLLQRISDYMKMAPNEQRDIYIEYQKFIHRLFAKLAIKSNRVYLSKTLLEGRQLEKHLAIVIEDESGQSWTAQPTIDQFRALEITMKIHQDEFVRSSIDRDTSEVPSTQSTAIIAEVLARIWELPKATLLNTSQFVDLVQPTINSQDKFVLTKYEYDQPRRFPSYLYGSEWVSIIGI